MCHLLCVTSIWIKLLLIIFFKTKWDHIPQLLQTAQGLPTSFGEKSKVLGMTYKALHDMWPWNSHFSPSHPTSAPWPPRWLSDTPEPLPGHWYIHPVCFAWEAFHPGNFMAHFLTALKSSLKCHPLSGASLTWYLKLKHFLTPWVPSPPTCFIFLYSSYHCLIYHTLLIYLCFYPLELSSERQGSFIVLFIKYMSSNWYGAWKIGGAW